MALFGRPGRRFDANFGSPGRAGDGRRPVDELPGVASFEIQPQLTDPALSGWFDPHVVAVPRARASRPRLWLFLSGSFGKPQRQMAILQEMVSLGHCAVNLCYPNDWTIGQLCGRSPDPDCHEKVRLEILDGRRRTDLVGLPAADCVLNRLVKLLQMLQRQRPTEGWGDFLKDGDVRWDSVAVAGHSQGGGHAALLGKVFPVARVVMLGAPADAVGRRDEPAPWLSRPGATPPERFFGFAHAEDPGFDRIVASWEALGMGRFGPLANVDEQRPPYGGSHSLVTNLEIRGGRSHGSVAVDGATPRLRDGSPAYREVWRHLFAPDTPA